MARATRLHTNLDRRSRPDRQWAIEGILPPTGLCQVFGQTGTGKSFVTIDLALRICNGMAEWYGHPINVHGPVVYVFMEGVFDQQQRIDAWLLAHPECDADNLWTLDEESFSLASPDSYAQLLLDIKLAEITPELLIIDTQALAMGGVDENDNGEMGKVLAFLKRMSEQGGYPILTVAHTGYDTTHSRGASAWKAGLDLEIHVKPQEVKVTKVKGAKPPEGLKFMLELEGDSAWAKPSIGRDGLHERGLSQKILDYVGLHPNELTMKDVLVKFGNSGRVRVAFDELVSSEELLRVEADRVEHGKTRRRDVWVVADTGAYDMPDFTDVPDEGDWDEIEPTDEDDRPERDDEWREYGD